MYPLIRFTRTVSAAIIFHEYPIDAIALAECTSVIIPILDISTMYEKLGLIVSIMYAPQYTSSILGKYVNSIETRNRVFYKTEIFCIFIFLSFFISTQNSIM